MTFCLLGILLSCSRLLDERFPDFINAYLEMFPHLHEGTIVGPIQAQEKWTDLKFPFFI